jgi:hypothetical protein
MVKENKRFKSIIIQLSENPFYLDVLSPVKLFTKNIVFHYTPVHSRQVLKFFLPTLDKLKRISYGIGRNYLLRYSETEQE